MSVNVSLVVSDNPDAYVLERARSASIPVYITKSKSSNDMDVELINELEKYDIDLIVLAGFLKMIGENLIEKYTIINTHPSLLPKFGGFGMYGMNVHKAVVESGEKCSGVTVHYVNSKYDEGNIISQAKVILEDGETPESLAKKVQDVEKPQLIEVIKNLSNKKNY